MDSLNGSYFNYLKECYELDTRTINLTNFYSRKVENRLWVEGTDEVLNGELPYLPILDDYAESIQHNLEAYSKEKSLYAFAHFVVGSMNGHRVCAPIIFVPAQVIEKDGFNYLELNHSRKFLNYNFLNSFKKEGTPPFEELFDFLFESEVIDFGISSKIATVLETHFEDISSDGMRFFPELLPEKKVKALRPKGKFKAIAGMGVGVLRYSSKTLGISSELKELTKTKTYSNSLIQVLKPTGEKGSKSTVLPRVPAILSTAQKRILRNAQQYTKSVVIGPPGTGKSFTIANMAVDHVLRGESILIVSKTDNAVDVILDKLESLGIGKACIRAGKQDYLKELKGRIQNMLSRKFSTSSVDGLRFLKRDADHLQTDLNSLGTSFHNGMEKELSWGNFLFENRDKSSVIKTLRKKYIAWRVKNKVPNWKVTKEYYDKRELLIEKHKELVLWSYDLQLASFLKSHRSELSHFLKALRARTLAKQEALFQELDFNKLLRTFPIWLCKLSDLYEVLPLQADLFDMLVIDEASQCDLASVMPAIQRAKKVCVVGDPNQLRHFSFVSRAQQGALERKYNLKEADSALLNYRETSVLDLCFEQCGSNDQVVFLDEHFRGNEQLMSFSNETFYESRLKIMKSLPIHQYQSLSIENCGGTRNSKGVNDIEIVKIVGKIQEIVALADFTNAVSSIGVISPFRKQSERLLEEIQLAISAEILDKHQILVGTPYSFQGNERDIMLMSWCIDDSTHNSAIRYINNDQVFNVAITRAKHNLIHFTSFEIEKLTHGTLLRDYLSSVKKNLINEVQAIDVRDEFMQEVSQWLSEIACDHQCDYKVASIPVDILITDNKHYKAIDLVGFPGEFFDTISLNQYMLLHRAGVSVFPLPYSYWYLNREFAKKEFLEFLYRDKD